MTRTRSYRAALLSAAFIAALPLAGCNKPSGSTEAALTLPALPATLPLAPGGPTGASFAPPVQTLPAVARLPVVRVADPQEYYAYADDALGFDEARYDAPPDYAFYDDDDEGVEPWGWEGYDQSLMLAEPLDDGYR